jgi:hypothetical protein
MTWCRLRWLGLGARVGTRGCGTSRSTRDVRARAGLLGESVSPDARTPFPGEERRNGHAILVRGTNVLVRARGAGHETPGTRRPGVGFDGSGRGEGNVGTHCREHEKRPRSGGAARRKEAWTVSLGRKRTGNVVSPAENGPLTAQPGACGTPPSETSGALNRVTWVEGFSC